MSFKNVRVFGMSVSIFALCTNTLLRPMDSVYSIKLQNTFYWDAFLSATSVLGIEHTALGMLGRYTTTEL